MNIASAFSCLFEAILIAGYFVVAWLLHSWVMVLIPFTIAGAAVAWAIIRRRFDDD